MLITGFPFHLVFQLNKLWLQYAGNWCIGNNNNNKTRRANNPKRKQNEVNKQKFCFAIGTSNKRYKVITTTTIRLRNKNEYSSGVMWRKEEKNPIAFAVESHKTVILLCYTEIKFLFISNAIFVEFLLSFSSYCSSFFSLRVFFLWRVSFWFWVHFASHLVSNNIHSFVYCGVYFVFVGLAFSAKDFTWNRAV